MTRYCPRCNRPIAKNIKRCPFCGYKAKRGGVIGRKTRKMYYI